MMWCGGFEARKGGVFERIVAKRDFKFFLICFSSNKFKIDMFRIGENLDIF